MNTTSKDSKAASRPFRSSISVSNEKVCEDEACIGKDVNPPAVSHAKQKEKSGKTLESSMSVGGKETCSDEACIGKQ